MKFFAPATSANLSVGFDVLGIALSPIDGTLLGDIVEITDNELAFSYKAIGTNANLLPQKLEQNLVYQAYIKFAKQMELKGLPVKKLSLTLEKNMPIGSGLGSSSCSIVASLVALNQYHGNPLDKNTMLTLMGELEGSVSGSIHYDNVAPAYLGGLQMLTPKAKELATSLPIFKHWYWVLAFPGIEVKTAMARSILPKNYSKQEIIEHGIDIASFIHALYKQDEELAAASMVDVIAEPYRERLLPNIPKVRQGLKELGALACGISGSGPTFYAVCADLETAKKAQEFFKEHYLQNDQGFTHICQVDTQGAREI